MPCFKCIDWFSEGYSVCPVCLSQREANESERLRAERATDPTPSTNRLSTLLKRQIYSRSELTGDGRMPRRVVHTRHPNRREAHRLTGIYFREEEAKLLLGEIAQHQWNIANQAGRNIWAEIDPIEPRRAASADWLRRHLTDWLSHRDQVLDRAN